MRRAAGLLCLMAVACGPPRQERIQTALQGVRPRLDQARRTLLHAAAVLPEPDETMERGCQVKDLPPVEADLRPRTSVPGNMDILMVDDVGSSWEKSRAEHPVARSTRLGPAMAWVLGGAAVSDALWASDVERAVRIARGIRYVLLFRVTSFKAPKALSSSEFVGGGIEGDCFLVDLDGEMILCVLPFVGKNNQDLMYFRLQGKDDEARLREFEVVLRDNLYAAARSDAYQRIQTLFPGSKILTY